MSKHYPANGVNEFLLFKKDATSSLSLTNTLLASGPFTTIHDYWFANEEVQLVWMRKAAQINADLGVVPPSLRMETGLIALPRRH